MITTKTILVSFIKKYSAITKIQPEQLRKLFIFKQVIIDQPLLINGAVFHFLYQLHVIPTIGFYVKFYDKSIYLSGDTYYDPIKVKEKFVKTGAMTEQRYFQINNTIWEHDLVLHECGVPPIHTSIDILAQLPNYIKEKLYLVHVA